MKRNPDEIKRDIEEFAVKNRLFLHPGKPIDRHVRLCVEKGHCPCDKQEPPERLNCPCHLALGDMERWGSCKCTMFVSEEYLKKYGYGGV